ncbi:MAG TPA: ABC transporter permease [Microthrixaceae bacterium]|nr:ABC transporter permease [Microthrixaceae bacterium]
MFLALRDLRVARGRFVLVGVVIGLVALLTTVLSGLANGLVDDGISGLRALPLTHLALQDGAESSFSRSTLTDKNLDPWKELAAKSGGDVEVSPLGVSFFNAKRANGDTIDIALFGVEPGTFLTPRSDAQAALNGTPGLVLSHEFESEGVKVGDELTIVGVDTTLPVLGFTYAGSYGHVDIAFSSLATWQSLVYGDNARGRFSAIAVRTDGDASFAAVDKAAGTEVETKEASYAGSPGFSAESATMTLIRGFLLVISALIVGAFFTVWTIQRTRQIGLLKALGASNGYVLRDALGQLAIVLVSAVLVGAAIALGVGALVPEEVPFSLEATPIVTSVLALVLLGMAGSLVAVRRITSVDPIVALSSEN